MNPIHANTLKDLVGKLQLYHDGESLLESDDITSLHNMLSMIAAEAVARRKEDVLFSIQVSLERGYGSV